MFRLQSKAGLDAGRNQGRIRGRPPKLRRNQQDEIVTMVSTGTKLPLTPRDFSMYILRQCRGFWLKLVPGLLG
jgi:DNA invertase Pin-like site-specific DNA recombinase